ncbi:MAG: tetratricopeptide repeat protein [Candidatus Caenarcaniphilales bacterium]|jgi:predicted O-linked N-acetylglucosamine transferase (SPINDLY family)|nr:tetratricopeptide repeat protein [Candidatus Caenarcaniphilales bacterium]
MKDLTEIQKSINLDPNDPKAWIELSEQYLVNGMQEHVIAASTKALELDNNSTEALQHLGNAYMNLNLYQDAINIFHRIIKLEPDNPIANLAISFCLHRLSRISEAYPYISKCINSDTQLKLVQLILGIYYYKQELNFQKAFDCFHKEIDLDPNSEFAYAALAHLYFTLGEPEKAIVLQKKQLEINPYNISEHNNLLMYLHYSLEYSPEDTLEASNNFYKIFFADKVANNTIQNDFSHLDLNPNKKILRIGFVSGDFKNHALFFWLRGLFEIMNSETTKIFCYCNNFEDETSQIWQKEVHQWTNIKTMVDTAVATIIRKDQIDILVDLSGHTALNRLGLFALKPAPVQVTWLGQTGPMGLPQIDYMISDPYLVFDGEEKQYIEKVFRLSKTFAPFSKPDKETIIDEPPSITNNYVTFGSCNGFLKINKYVLETWAELLLKFESSKLLIKSMIFSNDNEQKRVKDFFSNKGVQNSRIILEPFDNDKNRYLEFFNRIDIALDPFPLGGGTTTHDTLWMSTPIINLKGGRMSHRISSSILINAGFPEFVANTKDEYIEKIINLAKDTDAIAYYKKTIRQKYLNSPICDIRAFAKDLDQAFRMMWQKSMSKNHLI